jgi:hypothetical protein
MCKAKAVECQQQLTYNMAQGENMGFTQRLSYKNKCCGIGKGSYWLVAALEKDFDLVTLKPPPPHLPKRFSSLVWCTGFQPWDSQVANRITRATACNSARCFSSHCYSEELRSGGELHLGLVS